MPQIHFQFHGMQEDIVNYARNCVDLYNLYMVCIQVSPKYNCELIEKNELDKKQGIIDKSQIICLYCLKPDVSYVKYLEFINGNGDCIIFTIGEQTNNLVRESQLSAVTTSFETENLWKKVVSNFKKDMLKGAWVLNPYDGAKKYLNNHKYTYSAKKAFDEGIKMGALAGWCLYLLENEF